MPGSLVDAAFVADRIGAPDVAIIDASWRMPGEARSGEDDYRQAHIPGAVFFDIDAIADRTVDLPHMLPGEAEFAAALGAMGVADDMTAIVYDSAGMFSAPRVWWTLRAFGMERVVLLDGGLPAWKAAGGRLETGMSKPIPRQFTARLERAWVFDWRDALAASRDGAAQMIDARAQARFVGAAPEPRPVRRAGHIPGSLNVPWTELVEDGRLRGKEELRAAFARAGIDWTKPIAATCGSGVSAAIICLALDELGVDSAVYDGSWAEWGNRTDLPIVR